MQSFEIGPASIGDGYPPLFWSDIDVYFHGDLDLARSHIEQLHRIGIGFVKGALLHRADLCLPQDTDVAYFARQQRTVVKERYRSVIDRHILDLDRSMELYRFAQSCGLSVVLSVYDFEGVDAARRIGAAALKIPSSNIVHEPLILYAASQGLPLVLDTGKSTMAEICRGVEWARQGGAKALLLQHSPAAPPAGLECHHLRMLQTLRTTFDCPVGLSDHHSGVEMLYAAVALGACVLEKGVCADDAADDIDIAHALHINEVQQTWLSCQNIWKALGAPVRILPDDLPRPPDRMGLVARRALGPGAIVNLENIDFAFPTVGIPVESWNLVRGWKLVSDLPKGAPLDWYHVRPCN